MSAELVRRDQDAFELGKVFKASGMFKDMRSEAEAVVKIIAGREFGLGPMASIMGVHLVDGKPTLAANLIAGQIKRHPQYDYKVITREDDGCELEFYENGKPVGRMTWTKKDAEKAKLLGKNNWRSYPRDMYFARCLTSGARTYCPDVLGGSPIYTAEELGAEDAPQQREPVPVVIETDASSLTAAVEASVAADAEVVPAVETVSDGVLKQLRATYEASGVTEAEFPWLLLSVGVETLPENPTKADIGNTMRGLTLEQALKLEDLLKGNGKDDAVPGSGETA